MEKSVREEESKDHAAWDTRPSKFEEISKRRDTAFTVALGKLLDTHGNIESVMQTGEAFGRGLFAEFIQEKPEEWTMEKWLDVTMKNIFDPMGTSFTLSEI